MRNLQQSLPYIQTILEKHWHILNVNSELKKVFQNKPPLAFRKNKNLRQLIGGNTTEKNKKLLTTNKFTNGKCLLCFPNSRTLCCKQVKKRSISKVIKPTEHLEYSKKEPAKVISSLIANNNIRSVILEIKNDRRKIVKILIFRSLSREHFQSK